MKTLHHARRLLRRAPLAAAAALLLAFTTSTFDDFAATVLAVSPGSQSAGTTTAALGPPTGQGLFAGSTETWTLGVGGSITLGFNQQIMNAAGADFIVCENPFYLFTDPGKAFIEALFVEVSSNGVDFVRFPSHYTGTTGPFAPTAGIPPAWFKGLAGALPVSANLGLGIDPLDVVAAGGDAFDLADLETDPLVIAGTVDLDDIVAVRLVDVHAGFAVDSGGQPIWDCGLDALASADVDAVVAVNNFANLTFGRPRVELTFAGGTLTIRIDDDNGFNDVKAGLKASVNAAPFDFYTLVPLFSLSNHTPTGITLSLGPIPPGAVSAILKVGARDHTGMAGGDSITLQ